MKYKLSDPVMDQEMRNAVQYALMNEPPFNGEQTKKFEEEFAKFIGRDYAISCSSGTDALIMALRCLTPKRVAVPAITFIATANAVVLTQKYVKLVDVKTDTYNIDFSKLPSKRRYDIIIPVHLHGRVCEMEQIPSGKYIIEDCAQAHGAHRNGKKAGSFGTISCFSFFPTKNMTVWGDGGMMLTDNDHIAKRLDDFRWHCSNNKNKYLHYDVGYTARMSNIHAAIGRVQLKRLPKWNEQRSKNAFYYDKYLENIEMVLRPKWERGHVWHQYSIVCLGERNELSEHLKKNGIQTGIHYPIPINKQPMYPTEGTFPNARYLTETFLSLPVHQNLRQNDIKYITEKIKEALK